MSIRNVCKVLKFSVSNLYPIIQFGAFILSSALNRIQGRQGDIAIQGIQRNRVQGI